MDTNYTSAEWLTLTSELMDDLSTRLKKEFELGRITGTDYAQAYIANVNAATAQSQQFLLSKDTAAANADISRSQANVAKATEQNQIALSNEQVVQSLVQGNILEEQELQAKQQTVLAANTSEVSTATKQNQIDLSAEQLALITEQVNTQVNQTDAILAQTEVTRERGGFR